MRRNNLFNNKRIKISDIYVNTTGFLLQLINFRRCRKNSQHSMLANPDFNNISIDDYKQYILPKFMFELCVFVTSSLTILYVEVIDNIKYYIFTRKHSFTKKSQGISPTIMLASFKILNIFVSDIYIDDIADMIYQLQHLHLYQSFIKKNIN